MIIEKNDNLDIYNIVKQKCKSYKSRKLRINLGIFKNTFD